MLLVIRPEEIRNRKQDNKLMIYPANPAQGGVIFIQGWRSEGAQPKGSPQGVIQGYSARVAARMGTWVMQPTHLAGAPEKMLVFSESLPYKVFSILFQFQ